MKSFYQSMTGKLSKYKEMLFEKWLKPTEPIFLTSEFILVLFPKVVSLTWKIN